MGASQEVNMGVSRTVSKIHPFLPVQMLIVYTNPANSFFSPHEAFDKVQIQSSQMLLIVRPEGGKSYVSRNIRPHVCF